MNEVGFRYKFYLRNVSKRLDQSVKFLEGAQDNAIHAHMAYVKTGVTEESVALSGLDLAVCTALANVRHAQVLTAAFFDESKAPVEVAVASSPAVSTLYECDFCGQQFETGGEVKPGDVCPCCKDGTVDLPIPF